jgi:hypothetical protein
MMSSAPDVETADDMMFCASCGISECDNTKLKRCTACKLVRYCSVECQKKHRSKHKRACNKRADELRDELLFKQPESTHLGDCPICFIPIPLDEETRQNSAYYPCCSKMVCVGCAYGSRLKDAEHSLNEKCPFCRTPYPKDEADVKRMLSNRMEANDPVAIRSMGIHQRHNHGNFSECFKYMKHAAVLGDMDAHYNLGLMFLGGKGVAEDMEKANYHFEEAAIGGHPNARGFLGGCEKESGMRVRAMKHFIIAANQGLDMAVEQLKEGFKAGHVSKDDFAAALREYQRAVDATKTPQREAAKRNPDILHLRPVTN